MYGILFVFTFIFIQDDEYTVNTTGRIDTPVNNTISTTFNITGGDTGGNATITLTVNQNQTLVVVVNLDNGRCLYSNYVYYF